MKDKHAGSPSRVSRGGWRNLGVLVGLLSLLGCSFHHHRQVGAERLDDKVTSARVEKALHGRPEFRQVQVSAQDGVVTLTGSVPNAAARERAERATWTVHRVKGLRDELQVQAPVGRPRGG